MKKLLKSLFITLALTLLFTGSAHAATSVRLQNPASPTNQDTFGITFVALDTVSSQTVNVDCYKQAPGDANYSIFQSFSLPNGGNTNVCQVTSGIMNKGNGTYYFKVIASGSSSNVTAGPVSVNFNTDKPGQPVNYNKTKPNDCTYKIDFRTANDSGKTIKVVLYRSTDRSFSLDTGHQVGSVNIGSNTDGSISDNINPNCSTEYFYAIRAFDTYSNASDPNGDSSSSTVVISPTGTQQAGAGAIAGGTNGNVLSAESGQGTSKGVLGTESAKPTPSTVSGLSGKNQNPVSSAIDWVLTHKKIDLLVIILIALAYFLYKRYYLKAK